MTNIDMPNIEDYVDVEAKGKYKAALAKGEDIDAFMKVLNYSSRENGRTPMQWNNSTNAGFGSGTPWKRVNENYTQINVSEQEVDPNSILNHFKKMAQVRKENAVLVYGDYTLLQAEHPDIYAFTRTLGDEKLLVLLNFSEEKTAITLSEIDHFGALLINNYNSLEREANKVSLLPYQAVLLKLQ